MSAARKTLEPGLPDFDFMLKEDIAWGRWHEAPAAPHLDASCAECGFPGPLLVARGRTAYETPPPMANDILGDAFGVTHWAESCPRCEYMAVWRMVADGHEDWTRIAYRSPEGITP
jgi:hypothetical protein